MSFSDPSQPFFPPPFAGGDVGAFWHQFRVKNEATDAHPHPQFERPPPVKKPRNSGDNPPNAAPYPSMNARMHRPNPPVNKGINNIFFKTRICAKFLTGECPNGELCKFAHGDKDMRRPPENWQALVAGRGEDKVSHGNFEDDQSIIQRMKLCKKFCNGEECPYGKRCNFLHEDPSRFRVDMGRHRESSDMGRFRENSDMGRFRESSAISIGTTGPPFMQGNGFNSNQPELNRPVNSSLDVPRVNNMKPTYWKTRLCGKFETTGQCPFGDKCHFAHGPADLQLPGGRGQGESPNVVNNSTAHLPVLTSEGCNSSTEVLPPKEDQGKKSLLKEWKGPKKINRIYGDWIDDLPLAQSLPSIVES